MRRMATFVSIFILLVFIGGIIVQAGNEADLKKRWLGSWTVSLDGWKRSMVIRLPIKGEYAGSDYNAMGFFYDKKNDKKVSLKLRANISSSHKCFIYVFNHDDTLRLKLKAFLFNQNPSEMSGIYTHNGVEYGFYAKKNL